MEAKRMTTLLAVLMGVAAVCGCATMAPSGPTPEEEVGAALDAYHNAEKAEDVDGMVAAFSEDFTNSMGATKSMLRAFFEGAVSMGLLPELVIDMENCEVNVEGNTATAGPVTYKTSSSTETYSYKLKKEEDGVWRIINSEPVD